jgi:PKD repeat protein
MNFHTSAFHKHFFTVHFFKLCLILFLAASINLSGQISIPGIPESFNIPQKKSFPLPEKFLKTINVDSLLKADDELGIPNRYSVVQELNFNLRDSAIKTEIPGKGHIWQYELRTEKAFSLGILFKSFRLPDGAKVFIYTPDHSQILGAFTKRNNSSQSLLSIGELKENAAIIEYFEPYSPEFEGELILGSVSIAYRDIFTIFAATGRVDVNCSQGNNWQVEKRSVCRMTFRDADGGYFCTGFLVNNVREDLTPYFMSANHCISTGFSASTLVTYFNYENSECNGNDASEVQSVSGSKLIANSAASDFSLMLLTETPLPAYRGYLAGWDASGRIPQSGVGIHHPSGTPKCISTENNVISLYTGRIQWDNSDITEASTHWHVKFNNGGTEGGSSGSPFFDENHRAVGQLHGGDESNSYYGAFKVSWNRDANIKSQLKNWLDPDNTGKTSVDGKNLKSVPLADFSSAYTKVCKNDIISINDASIYEPDHWKWEISPASFEYMNGTDESTNNPEIKFTEVGLYSVKLIALNQWGSDTIVKADYFEVIGEINVKLMGLPEGNQICGCDFKNFLLSATGANDYIFTFGKSEKVEMLQTLNSVSLSLKEDQKKFGSFNSMFRVDGSVGSCTSSDSVLLKVILPPNDDIKDAISLYPGTSGPFSNFCASGQTKEAFPGPFNCYSATNWCPGSTSKGIQNSIWFTFIGPSNGKLTIDTKGINDRITIYEADSAQQIISGKPSTYKIIAANDDRSSLDVSSLLENLDISAGKKYWLQIESLDDDAGDVSISLITNSLEVFPNPSNGSFDVILSNEIPADADIYIYSSTGNMIYSEKAKITSEAYRFSFDLSSFPSGLYYIQTRVAGNRYSKKIVLAH